MQNSSTIKSSKTASLYQSYWTLHIADHDPCLLSSLH